MKRTPTPGDRNVVDNVLLVLQCVLRRLVGMRAYNVCRRFVFEKLLTFIRRHIESIAAHRILVAAFEEQHK
jgi:hypothetical protein